MDLAYAEVKLAALGKRVSHARDLRDRLRAQAQEEWGLHGPSSEWAELSVAIDAANEALAALLGRYNKLNAECHAERERRTGVLLDAIDKQGLKGPRTDRVIMDEARTTSAHPMLTGTWINDASLDGAPSGISDDDARILMRTPGLRWVRPSDDTVWYYDADDEQFYETVPDVVQPPVEQVSESLKALREAALGDGVWRLKRGS